LEDKFRNTDAMIHGWYNTQVYRTDPSIRTEESVSHLAVIFTRYQKILTFLVIGLLSVYAASQMITATPFGPAFGSDSVTYMESAKNFASGRGLGLINPDGSFRLLPYTAPFYSLALSLFAALRLDLMTCAFWLNALMFAAIVFLMGWSAWYFLRSSLAAILLSAKLALSTVMIAMHIWVMSDALSLALGLGGLVLMCRYLQDRSRKAFFWSAILAGLAFLSRYAGAAYLISGTLAVILLGSQSFKKRLVAASIYGFVSVIPTAIWMVIDIMIAGAVGSRSLQPTDIWLSRSLEVFTNLKETVYLWLPAIMNLSKTIGQAAFRLTYFGLFLLIGFACIFAIMRTRREQTQDWKQEIGLNYALVFAGFTVVYLVFILVTYAIFFPPLTLSDRMYAPINVSVLVLISVIIAILYRRYRHWLPRMATTMFAILIIAVFYSGSRDQIALQRLYPPGYTGFKGTGLIEYVKGLPVDTPIISDKTAIIQYYIGRPAYPIQEFFSQGSTGEYLPFGSDLDDKAQRVFREEGGALVLTWMTYREFEGLYGEMASDRYAEFVAGMDLVYDAPEGKVYFYQPPNK
jgi:4-amino-4-deoxy-L-arabinose transferase-like glycosyltransferase